MITQEITLLPYEEARDLPAIYTLWQEQLAATWPLTQEHMQLVLRGNEPAHLVAYAGERLVGCIGLGKSLHSGDYVGHLVLLLVAEQYQNKGIGTLLHERGLAYFQHRGVRRVQLGAISPRFWFAVPANLPQAYAFFEKRGWQFTQPSYDLLRSVKDFVLPEKISTRMQQEGIRIQPVRAEQIADLLAFEEREFSNWSRHFREYVALGDVQDLLIAQESDGKIVGSLILFSPQSHRQRPEFLWQELLGKDMGGLMAVGVAESERGRGIGIALVGYGGVLLRERGVDNALIDWVELSDFYAKLGWQKWRAYYDSWRQLSAE